MPAPSLRDLAAALLLALLGVVLLAVPAAAEPVDRLVTTTREDTDPGPATAFAVRVDPPRVTAVAGDALVVRNADASSPVMLRSTSENWSFATGPVGVAPGQSFRVDGQLPGPGTYRYSVSYPQLAGEPLVVQGEVVVPVPASAAGPAPAGPGPAGAPASSAPPAGQPAPAPGDPAAPAPGPASAGGSGATSLPALPGLTGLGLPGTPTPVRGAVLAPQLAPPLALPVAPGVPSAQVAPLPAVAQPPTTAPAPAPLAVRGLLPAADTSRDLGLPVLLAVVAAGGVLSLLVRVLLAEPVVRRPVAEPVARRPAAA